MHHQVVTAKYDKSLFASVDVWVNRSRWEFFLRWCSILGLQDSIDKMFSLQKRSQVAEQVAKQNFYSKENLGDLSQLIFDIYQTCGMTESHCWINNQADWIQLLGSKL